MKFLLKTLRIACFILIGGYVVFLTAPFALTSLLEKHKPQIVNVIQKSTGLNAEIDGIKLVTTPKFTAGASIKKFALTTPENEPVFSADNFRVKMSLVPLVSKTLRIDTVQLDNADVNLLFEQDGTLAITKYFPEAKPVEETATEEVVTGLPFGLKLSNHMPDIHAGGMKITLTDGENNFVINENKTDITDFIINKHFKLTTSGNVVLKDREQFTYDIKLFNKLMPEKDINELLFAKNEEEVKKEEQTPVNIIEILKGLYDYKVTAKAIADIKTSKDGVEGSANISGVSLIGLPESNADLTFKGNSIDIDSNIYTAENEKSTLKGTVTTGEKPFIDMNLKTALDIANLLKTVKDIALIFNIKDLQTLSASGKLNADLNIKSDMKTLQSGGYLKIPTAKVYYGMYDIGLDNISADVSLDNNNVNIKNAGFTVFSQPLTLNGTISSDAVCNLHLKASQLDVKGLLIALGQASIMKDNKINSGKISANVDVKGKIDAIKPVAQINISGLNVKNIPGDMTLNAPSTILDISSDGKTFWGTAKSNSVSLVNPSLHVNIPALSAKITENVIEILNSPLTAENIKMNVAGKVSNYLKDKIGLNFVSTGEIKSVLTGDLHINKQTLNLNFATTDLSSITIPGYSKSKMSFTGNVDIKGAMSNPVLSGTVSLPNISIPEIPVKMTDTDLKLNGEILHGSANVKYFESGGIKAENSSTQISMKGNEIYLKDLKGSAFSGKFSGDIAYNMSTTKTIIDFNGSGMNAESAIEGAAGIRKALTGTLGFDAKLSMKAADFDTMMRTLNGNINFDVKKGAYGTIGKLQGLLNANNIVTNTLLKNTVQSVASITNLASTGTFDSIDGKIRIADGVATLDPVKSEGSALCYYVTGKYNILNGNTNVKVLGRLDGDTVARLGALGELSASKLLSYIPKFGETTAKIYDAMTTDPDKERTNLIPALTSGKKTYKDFKVDFSGGLESQNSVKSFKWLTKTDATQIDPMRLKDTVQDVKSALQTDLATNVNTAKEAAEAKKKEVTDAVNAVKQNIDDQKKQIKETKQQINDLKNMFKEAKQQAKTGTSTNTSTTSTTAKTESAKPASTSASTTSTTAKTESAKPASTSASTTSTTTKTESAKPASTSASTTSTTTKTEAAKPASTSTSTTSTTTKTEAAKPASTSASTTGTTTKTEAAKPASTEAAKTEAE